MAGDTKEPVDMARHRASAPDRGGRGRLLIRLDRHVPETIDEPAPAVTEQLELFEVTENLAR